MILPVIWVFIYNIETIDNDKKGSWLKCPYSCLLYTSDAADEEDSVDTQRIYEKNWKTNEFRNLKQSRLVFIKHNSFFQLKH